MNRKKRKVENGATCSNIESDHEEINKKSTSFVEKSVDIDNNNNYEMVVNGSVHVIRKPNSALVHTKQGMLMKYFQKVKKCLIIKQTQLAKNVKEHLNQKTLENVALWMLGYVAKAYHYLRKKVEEHANDSMEVKDLSMRS